MTDLTAIWLDRLSRGECDRADQVKAYYVLADAIQNARSTAEAAQKAARVLAIGLDHERLY